MHVGWVTLFKPPEDRERPAFARIREHIESRLRGAPRYRQRIATVPLGIHDPVWVDDDRFDIRRHVRRSRTRHIERLVEKVFSEPLSRDVPLWELWIADELADGRIGVVGKVHHCMVDGIAAVELASLFLDPTPEVSERGITPWQPASAPGRVRLLTEAISDRFHDEMELVKLPAALAASPRRLVGSVHDTGRAARAVLHSFSRGAPHSSINEPISRYRGLGRLARPLDDLRSIKAHHGTTINDVVLAVSSGAMRTFLERQGETPGRLKAMVPVNVRGDDSASDLGNRVSFIFVELPTDEPDAVRRLEQVHAVMRRRKQVGEPRGTEAVLSAVGYAPHAVQHALTHAMASARTFNFVVSNVPGPRNRLYMMGCPLQEAYPIVPLADRHAVAIGFTTVADDCFFGVYVDRRSVPDADLLAACIDQEIDVLLAGCTIAERSRGPDTAGHEVVR